MAKHETNIGGAIDEARAARHLQQMMRDRPTKTRLVTRGQIFIQRPNEQPEQIEIKSIVELEPSEKEDQIWVRNYKLTEEWQTIDYGWIETPSRIAISNLAGTGLAIIPSQEIKDEIASSVVEVTFNLNVQESYGAVPDCITIHPGDTLSITTNNYDSLRIRTRKAGTKIKIHAFPGN